MTPALLLALTGFALSGSITPGPNNVMLMASGANFGLRRTLPHIGGIIVGMMVLVGLSGLGLGVVLERFPILDQVLKAAAIAFLVWLAFKIATAAPRIEDRETGRPLTFLQAAAFQWVNPKAWAMALSATAAYLPDRTPASVAVAVLVFGAVSLPSTGLWTALGTQMRRVLDRPSRLRAFNVVMAGLLLLSLWPILQHGS
ncbi:LysE family translocator [Histidinibacterium aquaticum]|uniref:LysE family translocator n=1 Tax=Histidinibacterium aquaticum TaxID=2613962 RepID=A0A5J5GBU7_9RHOB|nr:LysE family translocator [Histidinibacterium aquaticum]KAA9005616.1 LysE family translocator [Histidinibacterium aquaticum]